jgi:hypothetical protein
MHVIRRISHKKEAIMNRIIIKICFLIIMVGLFITLQSSAHAQVNYDAREKTQTLPDEGWPQVVQSRGNTITLYQPQVETWQDNVLKARAAVSVSIKASAQPAYGVVFFTARTSVDRTNGIVTFEDITINRINFPKTAGDTADYQTMIKNSIPDWPRSIALDRLQADLAITRAEMRTQQRILVKNDPPKIFFSTQPAMLVLIDGTPVPRAIGGTSLMRIINTRALMLLDKDTGKYYLYVSDHWEETERIEGHWNPSKTPPASLKIALEDASQSKVVDLLETDGAPAAGPLTVYVSTVSAELIITRGKPDLQPIDGTQLLACSNSDNDIFLDLADQHYYILLTGRWYRSRALEKGPWEFVPGRSLPADFANIPENHPKGSVLASVPGTPQAKEAVISNSIPQTATVKRNEAKADVTYDGDPQFEPIVGTPLRYAKNSPVPVIEVDPHSFFCVINGVWFAATSPEGPWVVTDRIPAVIYTIPPSCPIHYVVYVKIYGSTPDVVYVGYTPGYYGALIGVDGTVIYGTGYIYYPWIGTVWYGWPVTWGCGVHFGWYVWGWGWGWGYYYGWRPIFRPWWGPMWGWGPHWWHPWGWRSGALNFHVNVYNRWGNHVVFHNPVHVTRNRAVFRGQSNNHFAGHNGDVYRRGANGIWERHTSSGAWSHFERGKGFEGEHSLGQSEMSRGLGNHRYGTYHYGGTHYSGQHWGGGKRSRGGHGSRR